MRPAISTPRQLNRSRGLPMKILFATAEVHPLVKTGGLADVCGSLPQALQLLGHDVRLVLPAYPQAVARASEEHALEQVASLELGGERARLLEGVLPGSEVPLYLLDAPGHFRREGSPYVDADGNDWDDNAARFTAFARAVCRVALGKVGLPWVPDVVHCHDWHTGLVPALLSREPRRPSTVFTIHNLAYQGLFPHQTFVELGLPADLWSAEGVEFHGQLSFIKGGLAYADWISTVSPTYADEICRPDMGCGLDGLLRHRRGRLTGILNGADYDLWDPSRDPWIAHSYSAADLEGKRGNKRDLQRRFGLNEDDGVPLIASCGRLVEQKGVDLLVDAIPRLMRRDVQLVVVGTGERRFGDALTQAAAAFPGRVRAHVGYTEELAHQVEAGADMFLMPSRFEPCGLNQLYSLRYGTVPIVRRTGGLADTVVDVDEPDRQAGGANGFHFEAPEAAELLVGVERALEWYRRPAVWRLLATSGMTRDFSWSRSAGRYHDLYRESAPAGGWLRQDEALRRTYFLAPRKRLEASQPELIVVQAERAAERAAASADALTLRRGGRAATRKPA